ncbi:uncharacterized protein EV420DRAFT_1472409 [Desarmillaria tabescens]|uniref:Uncharacterized protein n=1 Tax=Armillaria tabescens TaxID=1929756 RepID=A0AA39TST5_ARMTA|nr:uncharacterized protein EV420DRAFT_1472409 [Desarmillaria tabescens]KAK0469122.1 hypothetical protein EV420DRAFT_1472409 [Desarmillaria tabescens]
MSCWKCFFFCQEATFAAQKHQQKSWKRRAGKACARAETGASVMGAGGADCEHVEIKSSLTSMETQILNFGNGDPKERNTYNDISQSEGRQRHSVVAFIGDLNGGLASSGPVLSEILIRHFGTQERAPLVTSPRAKPSFSIGQNQFRVGAPLKAPSASRITTASVRELTAPRLIFEELGFHFPLQFKPTTVFHRSFGQRRSFSFIIILGMATPSPANKFRTKTSDFADFLRGVGQYQHHTSTPRRAPDNLPTPSTSTSDAQDGVRRKKTLIPFFGRVRRKSNVSGTSAGEASEQEGDKRSQSLALAADDQRSFMVISPESASSVASASQNQLPNTTARVTKLRTLRKPNGRITGVRSPTGYTSDSLVPPPKKARPSIDSTTSKETRSTTPRPKQPTITISQPPTSFLDDNYDDLFTKPRKKLHASASPYAPTSSDHDDRAFHSDGDMSPTSFQLFPLSSSSNNTPQPASSTPMSPTSLREWRIVGDETSSLKSTRSSRRVVSDDIPRTSGEESEAISTISMPVTSASGTDKRSSMTSWLHNESRRSKSMIRSSMQSVPNQPPTIPLPATPGPSQTLPARLSSLPYSGTRPRAVTLSSSASPRANIATSPLPTSLPPRHSKSISRDRKSTDENAKKEISAFDIETATADQLRQALVLRDQQLEELASYLLKVTQNHVTEKNALEKKIASLEREAARREKEIKGLTWLVSSNRIQGSVQLSSTGSRSTPALESDKNSKGDTTSSVIKSPTYKHINSDYDDSGAESYPTSRTESARGSLSGGESSSSPSQQVKSYKLAPKLGLLRGSSLRMGSTRLALESDRKDVPKVDKRASVSSFASSAASSSLSGSSSMMLPSSPSTTTLSAIPEGPPPVPPKKPMSRDPAIAAAIGTAEQRREKEQKKVARSMNTAPTPAAAYAANLQKARPPSIGQILDQTENP